LAKVTNALGRLAHMFVQSKANVILTLVLLLFVFVLLLFLVS